jgi:hypothetical protein
MIEKNLSASIDKLAKSILDNKKNSNSIVDLLKFGNVRNIS